jgi:DNA-binding transcriptional LysR family regulator
VDRLESMSVFVDVVTAGSLAAAAEKRGLSPSMVGKHLRGLEARLGVRLLQRTTRQQRLTEAGALFLERCREILAQVVGAEDAAATLNGEPSGHLLRRDAPGAGERPFSRFLPQSRSRPRAHRRLHRARRRRNRRGLPHRAAR